MMTAEMEYSGTNMPADVVVDLLLSSITDSIGNVQILGKPISILTNNTALDDMIVDNDNSSIIPGGETGDEYQLIDAGVDYGTNNEGVRIKNTENPVTASPRETTVRLMSL